MEKFQDINYFHLILKNDCGIFLLKDFSWVGKGSLKSQNRTFKINAIFVFFFLWLLLVTMLKSILLCKYAHT